MPVNLLAVCRQNNVLTVKRIKTTPGVQGQLEGIFIQQENAFFQGITEEVEFDGGWNPEANELLYANITTEAKTVFQSCQANVVAIPELNVAQFEHEGVRALAVLVSRPGGPRLLLQAFLASQLLERNFSLILDGDTFNHLSSPAFSMGNQLVSVMENDRIKFRSYHNIKRIFNLENLYKEATDAEIETFCELDAIGIADKEAFKKVADQSMRKLVHAISASNTLVDYNVQQISAAAASQSFGLVISEDKIVMPSKKAEAKALLHFLDHGLYRAAITGVLHIANSKRRLVN